MAKAAVNDSVDQADIILDGDMTQEQIDEILERGDPDEIEAMMNQQGETEAEPEKPKPKEEPKEEPAPEPETEAQPEKTADVEDGESSDTEGDAEEKPAAVLAKNGKDFIPYEVLKSTREREREARAKLAELEEKTNSVNAKYESLASKAKALGLDLDEDLKEVTAEQLAELDQLDSSVADAIKTLHRNNLVLDRRNADLERQLKETRQSIEHQRSDNEVMAAIGRNTQLSAWHTSDPAKFQTATYYDDQLREDPAFQDKSLDERFKEAVRRTLAAYGEDEAHEAAPASQSNQAPKVDAKKVAAEKLAAAEADQAPRSLTDMGKQPVADQSLTERLSTLDGDKLQAELDKLSPDQLEQFYADLEFV